MPKFSKSTFMYRWSWFKVNNLQIQNTAIFRNLKIVGHASLIITSDVSANKSAGSWIRRIGLEVISGSSNHSDKFQNTSTQIFDSESTTAKHGTTVLRVPLLFCQYGCILDSFSRRNYCIMHLKQSYAKLS